MDEQKSKRKTSKTKIITYLEFYSGIGGWTYALHDALKHVNDRDQNEDGMCCDNDGDDKNVSSFLKSGSMDNEEVKDGNDCIPKYALKRLAAFDHSDAANAVLAYNDKLNRWIEGSSADNDNDDANKKSECQRRKRNRSSSSSASSAVSISIERLTSKKLSSPSLKADVWAMSPPCQPYTRNNATQTDEKDPRAKSFLHLCSLLREMKDPCNRPNLILVENVVGFEQSACFQIFQSSLAECQYSMAHFHLDPTQLEIPNHRPRYYCVAIQRQTLDSYDPKPAGSEFLSRKKCISWFVNEGNNSASLDDKPHIHTTIPMLDKDDDREPSRPARLKVMNEYLDSQDYLCEADPNDSSGNMSRLEALRVPSKVIDSSASWCFDIVCTEDNESGSRRAASCFTRGYGQFVRGTGSVLFMSDKNEKPLTAEQRQKLKLIDPSERQFDSKWKEGINLKNSLRYFSGTEIARLFGFPVKKVIQKDDTSKYANNQKDLEFDFPPGTKNKKQWQLLGNSLNVKVASKLSELGLNLILVQR